MPIFSFGQTITDIVVTTPINCYNDPECVDVEFQNLNSGQSYNLRIYIDNGTNTFPTLSNIFLDIASNANFSSSGNESFFNHCFVGIGKYKIELLDSDNNILSTLIHETDLWPFPLGLTDVSSSSGKNLDCNGDSDGELQVAGTGGTPPLVYNWSGPNGFSVTESSGTFSIINNLSAGTYLVSISDVNGCNTPNDIITVNQPSPINPNISTVSLETCTDDQDAVITANPFGGNGGPYSFEWNNGILTADNIVGAGTYSLVVQDVQGCFSPSTSYIVDPTPPLVAQAPVVIDPLCVENQGQVAIDVSGGTGVISYEWPNGTSTSSNNSLDVDDYTITIKDQNNCSIQSSFSISPADSILANITVNNNVTCFGNADAQIVIQISGGSPTYTVDQVGLNTGSTSFTINNNSNNIFNNLDVDSYQFFVSDNNACTNNNYPAQLLIVEPEEIILSSNNVSNISCFGENDGSINVTVQGGSGSYTYTWFDSNNSILGGNTNSISGLSADVYTLSVNDGVCQQSFDFTIIEPSPIILTSSVPNNISCSGSNDGFISNTVIDGGVAPYDYEWQSTSGVLLTDANPFNLSPSDYSLRVVDANNCPSLLLVTHTITEPNPLELLSSSSFNNPSCHNVNDGSIDVLANGGSPSYTFLLTEINTLISYGGSLVSDLPAGNYVLEVIDVNNCIDSTIFTFNNPLPLDFTTQISDLSCFDYNDGKIVFDFSTPNPPYTIELTNPQNNTQIVIDSVLGLSSGTYISTLTDASGCQQILTDVINSPDPILVNVTSESPSCNQNDVNQNNLISNGSLSLDISGASGIYEIIFDEDTSQAQLGIVYSLNNLSAGNYEVEVKDELGCSTIISETVPSASEIIVYTESQTDIVVNGSNTGSIQINPTGGLPPYDTDWLGPNFSSTSEDITNLFSGVYDLTITDNNGCVDFYTYSVNEDDCDISINPNIVPVECPGQNALVNFTISNGIAPYNCYMQGDIDGDNVIDEILPNQSINSSLVNSLSLPSGPYTLEVRDQSDCVQIYNFVIDQIDPIEINPELIDVSCYGDNDGKILIDNVIGNSDISGGTVAGTYDVQVQGLDLQDVNPFSLTAGEYIVLVLDDNDCPQTEYYTIQEPEEIIINDTLISHPNCSSETNFPGSDGEITVIPQGGNTNGTGIYLYSWGAPISSSLQTVTNLAPSTYNVSITDANNCTTNHFITLDEPDIIEYSIISSQPISCFNACDGEVTITTSNSENEFFNWFYNNDSLLVGNTNTISSLCEGSYSVSITNDKNCLWNSPEQGIGSEILTNPVEFSFDVNQSTPVQNGICDGFASINNIIGFGPFTYDWSNGETTSFVDDLCGEGYVVTVTDGSGCSSTKGFVIEEEECDFEIGALQVIQPECFGDNDGQIISFDAFNGGSAPYTVRRYAGSNDPVEEFITSNNILNFSSLSDGSYSIFVEDAGGCWDVFDTTIVSPLPISYSYYLENVDCYSTFDPEVHLTIVGGTQFEGSSPYIVNFPYEYYLATEQNGIESYVSGSPIVEGTSNNLFVTDANGCPPETFVVSVPPIDIINLGLTLTDPTCPNDNDGSAALSIVGGVSPYEINWYKVGNIVPLNGSTIDVLFIDTLVGGDYYIDVKDANGCNSIINFTINEMPDFVVNPIINLPSCIGESDATIFVQISGSNTDGSENLLWSPGSQTSNFVSGLQSGSYDLSITDSEQCTYTETIIVEDPEEIDLVLTTSPISCTGEGDGSISVSASGGNPNPNYQYQWYINGGEISSLEGGISDLIVNLNPATYSVVVTDNNGCEAELDQELVDPNPIEITSIESSNPKCFGSSDGSIVVTVAGEESGFIFSLKDGLGVEISSFSSANNLLADSYTLTVTDQYNCQLEESIVLIDPADLVIDVLAVDAICNGENTGSASFSIENHTEPLDIIWSSVQSLSSSVSFSFAETVSNLSIGNYNIQVTDAIGCSKTESFEILQPDPIVISTTVTPSNCANENGATAFASSTNAAAPVNYLWVINQGDNISQVGNQAINLGVGDIYLSGVDNNNCPIPQTVVNIGPSLNLLAQVEIVIEEENKCFNDNIAKIKAELSYSDGSPIIGIPAYQWYVDGVLIPSNLGGTVSTLVNVGPGTYSVDVTLSGCTNSDTIELVNPEQIEINIQNTIDVNCYGQNTGSVLASVSNGNAPLTYELDNLMGFTINNNLDNLNGLEAGDYNLIVTDNNNCVQSQEFVITQNDSLELNLSSISTKCFESSDGEI